MGSHWIRHDGREIHRTGRGWGFAEQRQLFRTEFVQLFHGGNLFGYYAYLSNTIIYHFDMGYEGVVDAPPGAAYMYDFLSGHWFYTSTTLFSYLYDFTLNAWVYYFPDTKNAGHYTTNPRYFVNLGTGAIFTM